MADFRSNVFREAFKNIVYLRDLAQTQRNAVGAQSTETLMRYIEFSNEIWRNRIMPLKDIGGPGVNAIAAFELPDSPTNVVALLQTMETAALSVQTEYRDNLRSLVAVTAYTLATGQHTWSTTSGAQRATLNTNLDSFIAAANALIALT